MLLLIVTSLLLSMLKLFVDINVVDVVDDVVTDNVVDGDALVGVGGAVLSTLLSFSVSHFGSVPILPSYLKTILTLFFYSSISR